MRVKCPAVKRGIPSQIETDNETDDLAYCRITILSKFLVCPVTDKYSGRHFNDFLFIHEKISLGNELLLQATLDCP